MYRTDVEEWTATKTVPILWHRMCIYI